MKLHTGIRTGDLIRCPDKATARWHRVVRVGRRRDGTRYVTVKARRFWRLLGCPATQRIEWATLQRMGFGIRRRQNASDGTVTGTERP